MAQKPEDDFTLPKMTQVELNEVIRKHVMFMTAKPGGGRAVVKDKDLSGLTFSGQNLAQSDFSGCILAGAVRQSIGEDKPTDHADSKSSEMLKVLVDTREPPWAS